MPNGYVKKEDLTGFRAVSAAENAGITRYMNSTLEKLIKRAKIFRNICMFFLVLFIYGVFEINEGASIGSRLFFLACAIGCTFFVLFNRSIIKENGAILSCVNSGNYTVMDCLAYKVELAPKSVSGAVAYIMDRAGQYCDERFFIDFYSAKEYKTNQKIPFLLVRIDHRKGVKYELFSNRKMGIEV